jgi:hypothetical protein
MTMTTMLTDEIRAKRVAVARDVIERIEAGKLRVATGGYLYIDEDAGPVDTDGLIARGGDLQPHVDEIERNCEVCALGAVLLSKARLMDAVPVAVLGHVGSYQGAFHRSLADVFDENTLLAIESAFEQGRFGDTDLSRGAAVFGDQFDDDAERCVAVMEKVIEGNGELAVPGMTEDEYEEWKKDIYSDEDEEDLDDDDDDDLDDLDDDDNDSEDS